MKKYLLPLLLLLPCWLTAQNWMPVTSGEIFHYRFDDSAYITHTIRVDSVRKIGSDSVFFLNRVLQWYELPFNAPSLALRNQGQFLGKTMTKTPYGELIFQTGNFVFDTTFVIRPWAAAGESWQAVPGENITASVVSMSEGIVLGETDSLKTIEFSNGAVWLLSKKHGLVRCPDFNKGGLYAQLSGLETKGAGDRLYRLSDFFDFNTGDQLEYYTEYLGLLGTETVHSKHTILQKFAGADTLSFQIRVLRKVSIDGFAPAVYYRDDTVSRQYTRSEYVRVLACNQQLVSLPNDIFFQGEFSWARHFEHGIQIGNAGIPFAQPAHCPVLKIPDDPSDPLFSIDDALACNPGAMWGNNTFFEEFRPKLGRVRLAASVLDNGIFEQLTGAYVMGDTLWGVLSPDWAFTSTHSTRDDAGDLICYPNPATENIWVRVPDTQESACIIRIFSAAGHLVRTMECSGQDETLKVDLSNLPTGAYFLTAQSQKGIWRCGLHKIN